MKTTLRITVGDADWNPNLGGWSCSVLGLPGSSLESFHYGGVPAKQSHYQREGEFIRWTSDEDQPESATLVVKVEINSLTPWTTIIFCLFFGLISLSIGIMIGNHHLNSSEKDSDQIYDCVKSIGNVQNSYSCNNDCCDSRLRQIYKSCSFK